MQVPGDSIIYAPSYAPVSTDAWNMLLDSISNPTGCLSLNSQLKKRREGKIVIVVSDITRPIPYYSFLPCLLDYISKAGISRDEIVVLVATGIHRPSSVEEKEYMFGKHIVENYMIVDHDAENDAELSLVEGKSWSGSESD